MGDQTGPGSPQPGSTPPPPPPGVAASAQHGAPFTDRVSKRWFSRQQNQRFIKKARESGLLKPEDNILVAVPLFKYSPGIQMTIILGLLPGIIAFSMQRVSMVVVTDRQVIVFPFFYATGVSGRAKGEVLRLNRPVNLSLAQTPKPRHTFGNKVTLPSEVSQFLNRPQAYVMLGNVADYAFQAARTPSS